MPATPPAPAHHSFAETLVARIDDLWGQIADLDPQVAGINLVISGAVVAVAMALTWILRRLFDRWIAKLGADLPPEARRTPRVAGLSWLLVRVLIWAVAVLVLLSVWGIDPWTWLIEGGGAGLFRLALILVLTTAAVEVAGFVIGRSVEGVARRSGQPRRAAQIRTIGPLIRNVVTAVLVLVGTITLLSELGVKVAPLIASAGIVGIAVGFGAQTLVKDFLTGLFLIAEDVVSVGDNIRIGEETGTVEAMTLRTIRLRNVDGALHIFPYSEAQVIHNRTKSFSGYVVEAPVSYAADLDKALAILGEVGEGLRADPAFKKLILQPVEVLGVDRLAENAVFLKARVVTKPAEQFRVGREYNRRLKAAFEAAGIDPPVAAKPISASAAGAPFRPPAEG